MSSPTTSSHSANEPRPHPDHGAKLVHAVLEEDQLYAFKQKTRFGRRVLSPKLKVLLWALRIYVLVMLIIVVVEIFRTMH